MNKLKPNTRRWLIAIIVIAFVLLGAFSSCTTLKKVSDKKTTFKQTSEIVKDTIEKVETNKAIKDNIVINVPETDNTEVMRMFNEMMNKMNTSKSSGSNSYKSTWDKENMQWLIEFVVGQTQNKELETNSDITTDKSFEQEVDEYIKKIVVPWWMYLISAFLLWPYVERILFPVIAFIKRYKK